MTCPHCGVRFNNTKTDDNTDKPDNIEEKEKELNLYTIDYDNMECIPNSVVVPGTFVVNAENIVNKWKAFLFTIFIRISARLSGSAGWLSAPAPIRK